MRDFSVCPPREGAQALVSAIDRLALTIDSSGPMEELRRFALALFEGDTALMELYYHSLTRALIACPARRISGCLWKDYLIYLAVQRPNAFSDMAAAGRMDALTFSLMRGDLVLLCSLMPLASRDLVRMAEERGRELRHGSGRVDDLSRMSTELWSGVKQPREMERPRALPTGLEPADFEWLGWNYGSGAAVDSFIADEALEEVYARLQKENWPELTDTLYDLFAAYGSGDFLRWRLMKCDKAGLSPLPDGAAAPLIGYLYEKQRTLLQDNVIRFMRGESAANMLLRGPQGVGKTASVYALAYELPEVRLIRLCPEADVSLLMARLADQPMKFIVLLDDVDVDSSGIRLRLTELCSGFAQPANVLLCATCRGGESSLLPLCVDFPCLTLNELFDAVTELLSVEAVPFDAARVRAMCVDHQVDCRDKLTYSGAIRIAQRCKMMQ